jgi:hypothetical protein
VRHILTILRVDTLGIWNGITRGSWRRAFSVFLALVFFLIFMGFVAFGGFKLASFTRDTFADYPALIHLIEFNVLSASSIAAFIMLFLTGIRVIYGNFYESGDLSFLMSTPLSMQSVFGAKFLKSFGTNFLSLLPLNGALWIGYGIAVEASPFFYVVVAATLLCVTSLFTALTSLVVMIIMRFIPSQKMKQIIMLLSLFVALIGVVFGQYISVVTSGDTQVDPVQLLQSTGGWGLEKVGYVPNVWMAKSILLFVDGYSFSFFESLLPLLVSSILLVMVSTSLAEWTFLTGWSQSRETDAVRKRSAAEQLAIQEKAFSGRSGALYGVLRKDIRVLLRTPMMWYNFLASLVIVGFMVYRMGIQGDKPSAEEVPFVKMLLLFMVLLMSASMSGFTSSFSVSLEGKSWWIMQHLPINPGAFYLAKLFYGYLPSFMVSGLIVLILGLMPSMPTYPIYISLLTLVGVLSVQVSIALVLDTLSPDFEMSVGAESLGGGRRRTGGIKVLVSMVASVLAVLLLAAIFAFPLYYDGIGLAGITQNTAQLITVIVFSMVIMVLDYACYFVGCKQLQRLFIGYEK